MLNSRTIIALNLCLILLFTACSPVAAPADETSSNTSTESDSTELIPIKLGVGFIPNVQFGTFYVGIEKGFYAEEGLDVALDYGFENDYLKLVGTDQLEFMVGSGDQVVIGQAQGLPVLYVMNWYTQYPVVVFAKSEANITEPADLAGKTIGIPGPFGANYVALRGLLEAAELSEADIQLESIGFTQAAMVSQDSEGVETTQIKLDKYLRIPANGLVTSETVVNENPELVEKMVRASLKAAQYTIENPDEAFEIALKFVPEAGGENEAANRAVFDAVLDYWTPQGDYSWGETRLADWEAAAALMEMTFWNKRG